MLSLVVTATSSTCMGLRVIQISFWSRRLRSNTTVLAFKKFQASRMHGTAGQEVVISNIQTTSLGKFQFSLDGRHR